MAVSFNKLFLAAVVIAATLIQSSTAQTRHVVGAGLGWIVPPNGAAAYSDWAANQTFTVGDTLVFNFATGSHDVTKVSQSSFNACTTSNPLSRTTTGPADVPLTASGSHYFICSFPGHCLGGQKVAVNVRAAASAPAPPPSRSTPPTPTPTPTPAPVPAPKSAPTPAPVPTPKSAPAPSPVSTPPASSPAPSGASPSPPSPTPGTAPPTNTPTADSPAGGAAPPPPDNSAKSLGAAGFFTATFFTLVVGLLY